MRLLEFWLRKTSLEEKELWPEFFWAFSSLLKAGYLPVQALESLLTSYGRRPATVGLRARLEHGARCEAEVDLLGALSRAVELGRLGYPLAPAFTGGRREYSVRRLAQFSACLQLTERTGAPLAAVIENLARYCEKDIDAELARDSAMSAPVTTGKILSLLPLLGLGLGILMGTDPLGVLFGSLPGGFLAVLGAALAFTGQRWTARLVREAEQGKEKE